MQALELINFLGGETFLQAVYQLKPKDLRPWEGIKEGWVLDGCFQEIKVDSGLPVFQWCGLDHMDIDNTLLYLHSQNTNYSEGIGGKGVIQDAWDWMHMNAISKNTEGDYLVSARHLSQIFKVAGKNNVHGAQPGTVLWQLGGKRNDFTMQDDWSFSRQHMVRVLKTTAEEETLSVFNNGWVIRNKNGLTDHASSGQVMIVNNRTMTARLTHEYIHPHADQGFEASLTMAAGSMEVQPNGGAVVGWGTLPELTEYAEDGEVLFHAFYNNHSGYNYRSYKREWVGKPQYPPKMVAYSRTCKNDAETSPLMAYVSWNGATEVTAWRFYVSTTTRKGPWIPGGTFPRDGFETAADLTYAVKATLAHFAPYVYVEALDASGAVLGSTRVTTFVPTAKYDGRCDALHCFQPSYFEYEKEDSCGASCGRALAPTILVLLVLAAFIEAVAYTTNMFWHGRWRAQRRVGGEVEDGLGSVRDEQKESLLAGGRKEDEDMDMDMDMSPKSAGSAESYLLTPVTPGPGLSKEDASREDANREDASREDASREGPSKEGTT